MLNRLIAIVFFVLTAAMPIMAEGYSAEDIKMVHLQDRTKYACNPDGLLSDTAVARIDSTLSWLETNKGIQTILVVVKKMDYSDSYTFAMKLAKLNKPGSKTKNTGLVIVLSTEDRQYTILTGKGLEGTLPDAICKRIENRAMVPYLKEGNWDAAMVNAVTAIKQYAEGDKELTSLDDEQNNESDDDLPIGGLTLGLIGIGGALYGMGKMAERQRNKCPKCGKHTLRLTNKTDCGIQWRGQRKVKHYHCIYTCQNCGYQKDTDEYDEIDDGTTGIGRMGAPIIFGTGLGMGRRGYGGGFGSGSFGGGFSGGSFGGGSFGGGGASGNF